MNLQRDCHAGGQSRKSGGLHRRCYILCEGFLMIHAVDDYSEIYSFHIYVSKVANWHHIPCDHSISIQRA